MFSFVFFTTGIICHWHIVLLDKIAVSAMCTVGVSGTSALDPALFFQRVQMVLNGTLLEAGFFRDVGNAWIA